MPIIKSAKKRVRVIAKASARNRQTKDALRSAVKAFSSAISTGKKPAEAHAKAQSELDKAAKKGVLHPNKVARKKRQMAKAAKAANQKIFVKSTKPAVKPVAKKAPAKVAAKKPVVKKAPAKKPSTKKK